MTLNVLFFASLREQLGCDRISVSAEQVHCLTALLDNLHDRLSQEDYNALRAPHVRIAVNQALIQGNPDLEAGDEIAFLPPVTGG